MVGPKRPESRALSLLTIPLSSGAPAKKSAYASHDSGSEESFTILARKAGKTQGGEEIKYVMADVTALNPPEQGERRARSLRLTKSQPFSIRS